MRGCLSITTILDTIDRMQTIRLRDRMERRILSEPQSRCPLDDILKRRVEMRFHMTAPRVSSEPLSWTVLVATSNAVHWVSTDRLAAVRPL